MFDEITQWKLVRSCNIVAFKKRDKRAYHDDIVVAPGDLVAARKEVRDGIEEVPDLRFHFGFWHCYCSICSAVERKLAHFETYSKILTHGWRDSVSRGEKEGWGLESKDLT